LIPPRANSLHLLALACILLLAGGVRFAVARHFQGKLAPGKQFEFGDSETYWRLAETIDRGEPYAYGPREYRVMRTPGYPVLLAGVMRVVGIGATPWQGRLLSVALGVFAVLILYAAARAMFDPQVALLAALIASLAPCAVASSIFVLAEAPFIPVMIGQLWLGWMWLTTTSSRQALFMASLVGVLTGLGALVRPSWLLFTPFAMILTWIVYRKDPNFRGLQFAPAVVCLMALSLTMCPWWVRNHQVSGRFIATTLQAGPSLYDGWRPDADGASDMRFVEAFEARADESATIPKQGIEREIILSQQMSDAARDWAKQNPLSVLRLACIKLLRTWNVVPNFSEMQSPLLRMAVLLGYVPVMITAGLGAWRFRARTEILLICLLPAVYFSLLHMIYVGSIRYRQPAMFPLLILSAAWIVHFGRAFVRRTPQEATA
jgi:4-amino-4-deoxy-L-arabinose transferase-like glycosyltransferase